MFRVVNYIAVWVVLCSLPAAASLLAAADDNWPQFRGPRGDGTSDATGLPTKWSEKQNVKWKTPLHDRGWSSPVVWGDQIWVTAATEDGRTDYALCVEKNTGKILHDIKLWDNDKVYPLGNALNGYASCTPAI